MRSSGLMGSVEAIRGKLRGLTAVVGDTGATEHERATAETLKARIEQRLKDAGTPAGDWTDSAFRLGRWTKEMRRSASPAPPARDWTENAFRLGKVVRRGYKKGLSE
jgi:hypothetical protein